MPFERSLEIERRLDNILRLIRTGRYSTPMLAEEVGVSIPTISRCVTALRVRGHDIRAEKNGDGWRYVLAGKRDSGNERAEDSKTKSRSTASKLSGHDD
jgi:predicted DNA-binding transcriptional regulator YafY